MQGAFTAHLVAGSLHNPKPQKLKDLGHRNVGPKLPKVDARHGCPKRIREEEPVIPRPAGRSLRKNRLASDRPKFF
jgi:hypothetical protein